jgi:thioredoxin-dependent peroxiredoxin
LARVVVGEAAPEFTLKTQSGQTVGLRDFLGKSELVLYFYPKDNTPGCTTEAKAFRDHYESFREMGAEVVGISSDSVVSHQDFAAKCGIPFMILSDEGGKVRKLYGVPSSMGFVPGRVTYVIDAKGIVRHIFNSQMNPAKHVEEAIRVIEAIRKEPPATGSRGDA